MLIDYQLNVNWLLIECNFTTYQIPFDFQWNVNWLPLVLGHLRAMHRSKIVEEQNPIATNQSYNIRKEQMLPYIIYINEDEFQCSICNESYQKRDKLFDHFRQ